MTERALEGVAACPACTGPLVFSRAEVACQSCDRSFPIVDGIPVLLPDVPLPPWGEGKGGGRRAEHDEVDHRGHKHAQAAYYDSQAAEEFEIERPNHSPRLYQWLMREKFRRSLAHLSLPQPTLALTVCGGSGMEAQFLAEAGFRVIASDLSLGAARRCLERARRFRLAITPIVADVEHLPFRTQSIPLVYVHDGLHHLEDPMRGLEEMARVALSSLSITEPANAAVTGLAIRLGLARRYEEPGNRVARLDARAVRERLQSLGFRNVRAQRYAMFYRHQPGVVLRLLSHPALIPIATRANRVANLLAGRWGNKLAVTGVTAGMEA